MQSFLKEAPLCLILGCVSKTNLKTRSSPALRSLPSRAFAGAGIVFLLGLGFVEQPEGLTV